MLSHEEEEEEEFYMKFAYCWLPVHCQCTVLTEFILQLHFLLVFNSLACPY